MTTHSGTIRPRGGHPGSVDRRVFLGGSTAFALMTGLSHRAVAAASPLPGDATPEPVGGNGERASEPESALLREKLDQATAVLDELDIDLWMPVARESDTLGDPVLPLIVGTSVTWESAFLVSRTGHHQAIVGSGDVANLEQTGVWENVTGYVQDFGEALRGAISAYDPAVIALNFSRDNFMADGLTHGMYLRLQDILGDTPYWSRVVSGEPVSVRVRARKSAEEQRRIRAAVTTTVEIWNELEAWLTPGVTEREIADFMHGRLNARGITSAWDWGYCPTVIAGPNSPGFHTGPGDIATEPGQLLSIDFGVKQNLYTSDMQRSFYLLQPGETEAPAVVRDAFAVVDHVIQSAAAALKPGVRGVEVDQIGRDLFQEAGFDEWPYALGHQIGRIEHDGGTLLAPKWERYGSRPDGTVEADEVYAIEIGTTVEGYGWVSLEENLVVTPSGAEFLAPPQRSLTLIG